MKRALARLFKIATGTAVVAAAALGFAHTPAGRPLLSAVTRMAHGGCPLGYDRPMDPAERERAQHAFAQTHRKGPRALRRLALGFELERTTRSEVIRRLGEQGVRCTKGRGLSDLTCNGVPSAALGETREGAPARNLWLTFGTREQLLSLTAISRDPEPAPISRAFVATTRALREQAGQAELTRGDAAPEALSAGALRQASAEFRFHDYYAVARATNSGRGFVLTEEYRSFPD